MPSGGSAKELHPPWAKLSSLGPKGPWDDNIALGGCNSFALPPEGMQLPIASIHRSTSLGNVIFGCLEI